ncbi:TetR/AcrR family transcriptional regulator [Oryzibacter oryziterrae]|uniref:TetR/AcrR family transcriptional regulator n=1 Tax=Oryzibacter oryziterrae TaxID=2766474 RepID=UPI001F1B3DE4|nr:TetR/AcrR family transcriptional regulator [Oryzibacter oryziterrae]
MSDATTAHVAVEAPGHDSDKRRQIMVGAREVFLAKGYEGASMDAIAKAAGVSKGTLYVYFASKDVLFEALIVEEKQILAENLITFDASGASLHEELRRIAINYCELLSMHDHTSSIRMVLGAVEKFPAFGRVFFNAGPQRGVGRLAAYFEDMVAAGRMECSNPEAAARHFIALCTSDVLKRSLFAIDPNPSRETIESMVDEGLAAFARAYGLKS